MGITCCSTSLFEHNLDLLFKRITIHNSTYKEINSLITKYGYEDLIIKKVKESNLKKNQFFNLLQPKIESKTSIKLNFIRETSYYIVLTESNFYKLINEYLLVEDYEKEVFHYFSHVFHSIKSNLRYPILKIILVLLLGKYEKGLSETIFIELIVNYCLFLNQFVNLYEDISLKTVTNISIPDLFYLLKTYLTLLTFNCIESFGKSLMKDDKGVDLYNDIWKNKIIDDFITSRIILPLIAGEDKTKVTHVNIEKFVKENMIRLAYPESLRLEISDYGYFRRKDFIEEKSVVVFNISLREMMERVEN